MRKREALYGEFISECAKLLIDAFDRTRSTSPEKLLPALRADQPHPPVPPRTPVLAEAERLLSASPSSTSRAT